MHEDLFGEEHVHKALESRDVMGPQGDAREDQLAEDSTPELEACSNDSASDKDGDECAARHLQLVNRELATRDASDQVQECASEEADSNLTTTLNFSVF